MAIYLLTWNPKRWNWEAFGSDIENVRSADPRNGAPITPSEFAPTYRLCQGPGQPSIMRL